VGNNISNSGTKNVCIGDSVDNSAQTDDSVLIGNNPFNTANECVGIGKAARTAANGAIAIGPSAGAWGVGSTSIGVSANVSGAYSSAIALGNQALCSAESSIAIGPWATVWSGNESIALGFHAETNAAKNIALGHYSNNRISETHVISGPSLLRKDDGESATEYLLAHSAQETVIATREIDAKLSGDDKFTIPIPAGSTFFPSEVGFVVTSSASATVAPFMSVGVTGATDSILATIQLTKIGALNREIFDQAALVSTNGVTSLTVSVKTAATATTLNLRMYVKGILIEDE